MADKYDKYRPHTLCLWKPSTSDRFRETTYQDAVEIKGRWFQGRHEYVDSEGKTQTAEHSAFVDQEVPLGSYLRKGKLSELDSESTNDPLNITGPLPSDAHKVVDFSSVWDFENVEFRSVSMT